MPTHANEKVLRRELSIAGAKPIIDIGDPLLLELVNYSTNVFLRCATSKEVSGVVDTHLAPIVLYRQMIELADGIQVLTSQCISSPAIPTLRSMFEVLLAIEFILETQADYEQRSLAWLVGYARERLHSHKQLSLKTTQGKQFEKYWQADSIASKVTLPFTDAQIDAAIANMDSFLDKPHIKPVNEKFEEYKRTKKRKPNWFSIADGPNTIEELSVHLKCGGLYNVLYRTWSSVSHATDLLAFIAPKDKHGRSGIKGLRDPNQLKDVYTFCASFMIAATKRVLNKFRPGEEEAFSNWYTKEIRNNYMALTQLKVEISPSKEQ